MQNQLIQSTQDHPDELAPGTSLLRGQYIIESYLVRGGFGITYLARDSLDRQVVIKECFPSAICCRLEGQVFAAALEQRAQYNSILRHFIREARRLARLSHPNIVGVHQVFEENSTAYMALDYVDGMDLLTISDECPERLNPDLIRSMLMKSLGAISYIHDKGILHRDISPDNLLLDGADNLTLIDFGAAREPATADNREIPTLLAVKDGYSPPEFYQPDVTQNPSSDLYSLGATFYHLIQGEAPPSSQKRLAAVAGDLADPFRPLAPETPGYERAFLAAINTALEVLPEHRLQSAQQWGEAIDGERRAQAALARASRDASIQVTVSRLVADTNRGLQATQPEMARQPGADEDGAQDCPGKEHNQADKPVETPDEPRTIAQPVDMFGTPIDDVEAWLWAQDRIARRNFRPEQEPVTKPPPPPTLQRKLPPKPTIALDFPPKPQRSRFLKVLMGHLTPDRTGPLKRL